MGGGVGSTPQYSWLGDVVRGVAGAIGIGSRGPAPVPTIPTGGGAPGATQTGDILDTVANIAVRYGREFLEDRFLDDPQALPSDCPEGFRSNAQGQCVPVGGGGTDLTPGVTTPAEGAGQAVMGRYGVAMVPYTVGQIRGRDGVRPIRRCLPGMVLGKDNLCYDSLRKSERKWPPGRKPLLTGGEMNAITKAARAASRLHRTQKRLKKVQRTLKKVT